MSVSKDSSAPKRSKGEEGGTEKKKTAKVIERSTPERPHRRSTAKQDIELLEKSDIPLKPRVPIPVPPKHERRSEHYKEVKVPKINTKTSIPYNPDYVPMEKREEPPKIIVPLVKYSDYELNEFRDIITKKVEIAKKELAYLQGLVSRKDGQGGDHDEVKYMTMEDGNMSMEREQLSQMASRQASYIDHLEKALIRIENKTYGVCRITGKLIDKARLKAVPHATLSLEAKLGLVKFDNND